jgi:hypothetical protein
MSGSDLTLGAVLAHLEEQQREIAVQAEATRGRIAELAAQLEEFDRVGCSPSHGHSHPERPPPARQLQPQARNG